MADKYKVRSSEEKKYARTKAGYEKKYGELTGTDDIKKFEESTGATYQASQTLPALPDGKIVGGGDLIVDRPTDNLGFNQGDGAAKSTSTPVTTRATAKNRFSPDTP